MLFDVAVLSRVDTTKSFIAKSSMVIQRERCHYCCSNIASACNIEANEKQKDHTYVYLVA